MSSRRRTFFQRSFSTILLVAVAALAFSLANASLYFLLFVIFSLGALNEYFNLYADPGFRRFRPQVFGVAILYLSCLSLPLWGHTPLWMDQIDLIGVALLFILITVSRLRSSLEGPRTLHEISAALHGFVYCILLFAFVPKFFFLPLTGVDGTPSSNHYLIYLIAVTKLSDTGAYLVGSLIGKQKLVPHISPGKTWQGFWGALGFAIGGSYFFWWLFLDQVPLIGPISAGILGLVLGLVAVVGDLIESIVKRSLAVKDSGQVMPGIGGFLDLVDSIILTAPVFYFYLRFVA